jgi:hypothetical protein
MRTLTFLLVLLSQTAAAHEFWIEPLEYVTEPGGRLVAHLVNGDSFEGTKIPYWRGGFHEFRVIQGSRLRGVPGKNGAMPALNMPAPGEGLNVVVYQSKVSQVTYETLAEFVEFAEQKDFPDVEARHRQMGYPEEDFTEAYTRYAKSLFAVGGGAGADRHEGLEAEIVALTNPYTDDLSDGMRVQVFFQDAPRGNALVEVFEKSAEGEVEITRHRTDASGIATVPVKRAHRYLFDAVVLRVPAPDLAGKADAVWETLWASLTFAVP